MTGARTMQTPQATVLTLDSVDLRYGNLLALAGVSLAVARGERLALVGANGSGKSSLLRLMHGLSRPAAGLYRAETGLRQAMVFQRPWMLRASAQNNVALGLWFAGAAWREARLLALAALEQVELVAQADRNAKTLSGGQQQRLALARAWAVRPDLLLLDEPTANLDPHAKREVEALMARFAQQGCTLVFSSHNLGQVKRLATRVVYIERGVVVADLPVHAFFNGPLPEAAALFLKGELGWATPVSLA